LETYGKLVISWESSILLRVVASETKPGLVIHVHIKAQGAVSGTYNSAHHVLIYAEFDRYE